MGKACGLHSNVTVLPALALSKALRMLPVKSGGEAVGKSKNYMKSSTILKNPQRICTLSFCTLAVKKKQNKHYGHGLLCGHKINVNQGSAGRKMTFWNVFDPTNSSLRWPHYPLIQATFKDDSELTFKMLWQQWFGGFKGRTKCHPYLKPLAQPRNKWRRAYSRQRTGTCRHRPASARTRTVPHPPRGFYPVKKRRESGWLTFKTLLKLFSRRSITIALRCEAPLLWYIHPAPKCRNGITMPLPIIHCNHGWRAVKPRQLYIWRMTEICAKR